MLAEKEPESAKCTLKRRANVCNINKMRYIFAKGPLKVQGLRLDDWSQSSELLASTRKNMEKQKEAELTAEWKTF